MRIITGEDHHPIHAWTDHVPVEPEALTQLRQVASLPFIHHHVAVMPDVHWGQGATVGSVIATIGAVVPAAVGVDIGCGMIAVRTSGKAEQLPDNLLSLRTAIERAVPHGRTHSGGSGDEGAWSDMPAHVVQARRPLAQQFELICQKHPRIRQGNTFNHLGTLGGGNHFVEVCLDESGFVWAMLHSGSRGVGNRIDTHFIALAKKDMLRQDVRLPHVDLAYLNEGSEHFDDYCQAVLWAQRFAEINRELMMRRVLDCLRTIVPTAVPTAQAVDCHHNYVSREEHFGAEVIVTRKGAVSARTGELGIIPGSMGQKSYVVRGKGNADSFHSCSHGAGRAMSRGAAKKRFTVEEHERATLGVECRKDAGVLDETPAAYKDLDAVMASQTDLVDVVHTLKAVLCVKG